MKGSIRIVAAVLLLAQHGVAFGETPTERRLRVLEEQLKAAQEEIKHLRDEVKQEKAVGQAIQRQAEQTEQATKPPGVVETVKAGLPDWIKSFTPMGELRLRYDGQFHQPTSTGTKATANNQARLRARLGVKYTYSDELSGTIRLATGNPNNPISENQTLTGNFTPLSVNIDWAFMTLTPGKTFGLRPGLVTVNAGKIPVTLFKADELVWDDDLAPEGATETFALLAQPIGNLDQIRVHGTQWVFNQVSNGPDGWMFGAQINPQLHFGTTQLELGVAQYGWLNSDYIAQAANTNSSLVQTNSVITNASGIVGYAGAFNQTNVTALTTIPDVAFGQPLRLWGDYVYNWLAPDDEAHGWQAGVRLGQAKKRGDWTAGAYYQQLERNATISDFTASDFGAGGTNTEGPGVRFDYQLFDPVTLTAQANFTNYLERPAGKTNPTAARVLVDAQFKF